MPDQFKHYWPLSDDEKKDVWDNGAIVLDANIYLHIYRFPSLERDRLLQILETPKIQERLWIPHQVAEEYYRNRLSVIGDQIAAAKSFLNSTDKTFAELFCKMDDVIRKHHPLINREAWRDSITKTISTLKDDYEKARKDYPVSVEIDPLRSKITKIMKDRIGPSFTNKELDELRKEGKERFDKSVPPGYQDAKKDGDKALGDFLLWKQCLLEMEKQNRNMILVIDDRKDDWWLKMQGQLLGPRPELRKEYKDKTTKEVDFVSAERFIEWATKYLGIEEQGALEEAITETRIAKWHRRDFITAGHGASYISATDVGTQSGERLIEEDTSNPREMAEWFMESYEDPANHVPYESREGGYQYYAGGPYDAEEVLYAQFPEATEEAIADTIDIIEREGGPEWVRKGQYP